MILKFSLVSDEVADFKREIQIDGDSTFLDLHNAIIECTGYDEAELTAFFLCDDWWKRKQEITSVEVDTYSDEDNFVMEDETLSDWLDEEKQKLMFVFDYEGDRGFYMELSEMILGKYLSKPTCTNKKGTPPAQFLKEEEPIKPVVSSVPVIPIPEDDEDDEEENDDAFYGDDDFNEDEIDMDGFEGVDEGDIDLDIPEDTDLM